MTAISLALPRGRAGLRGILPAVRERKFPPSYLLAGCIGGFFVFAQSFTVGLLGVALFTVATDTGQTLSGLLVDRMGIGPAGKRSITGIRVIGSILTRDIAELFGRNIFSSLLNAVLGSLDSELRNFLRCPGIPHRLSAQFRPRRLPTRPGRSSR